MLAVGVTSSNMIFIPNIVEINGSDTERGKLMHARTYARTRVHKPAYFT